VFTARYALSPCIKQARFVFKGLTCHQNKIVRNNRFYDTLYATDLQCQVKIRMWLALLYELWTETGAYRADTGAGGQAGRRTALSPEKSPRGNDPSER
jgi:catalase (peroxidase I)